MRNVEEYISPLVEGQFPAFYHDDGPMFIAFVKAYYEWAESNLQLLTFEDDTDFNKKDTITQGDKTGTIIAVYDSSYLVQLNQFDQFKCNTLCNDLTICTSSSGGSSYIQTARSFNHEFLGRRLFDIKDIDETIDKFIISFKNKYLPDIQFNTASNKRLFIKNSLDFYRAKGTERAVDLFFKLIYAIEAGVYYPGDDIFKLSDNEFVNVQYLEVQTSPNNVQFVGQTVRGADSGAEGYVERMVRVRKNARFIEVLFVSNVSGRFITNEQISTTTLSTNYVSKMIGSLSFAEIERSNPGHVVGDNLSALDGSGKKAKFRVTEVEDITGIVEFVIENEGWGYTADAEVIGSDKVLRFNNLTVENTELFHYNYPFHQFETIQQDLVSFTANTEANTGVIALAQTVYSYDGSNVEFQGTVVSSNSQTGVVIVNYNSNNYANDDIILGITELLNTGNTVSMNVITDVSIVNATANVIATSKTSVFDYSYTGDTELRKNDVIYQKDDYGAVYANAVVTLVSANAELASYTAQIESNIGNFRTNRTFYREFDDAPYTLNNISNTDIGIVDIVNTFYENANTYGLSSGSYSPNTQIFSYTSKANFSIQSLKNTKEYYNFFANDVISTANLNQIINSSSYGLSANASIGYNGIIGDALPFTNTEIGSLELLLTTNPGEEYASDPFYIIFDKTTKHLERYDYKIIYSDQEQNFQVGETILGSSGGATAVITEHDRKNRTILATRTSLPTASYPTIEEAANTALSDIVDFVEGEEFTGLNTNITTTISYVNERRRENRTGLNAEVSSQTFSGNGYISAVSVIDSGFGYQENELINVQLDRIPSKISTFRLKLGNQGVAPGYFTSRKGFLSSDKYLHDNDFYQEYSYQVLTSLPFETYKQTLIDVLHVAGTKPFGKYVGTTVVKLGLTITTEVSDYEIGKIDLYVNENIIYPPTRVVWTYRPALFDSSAATQFFAPTLIGGILRPSLFEDTDSIFGSRVFGVLRPTLHNDTDSFFASTVAHVLRPTSYNDTDSFFAPTVTHKLSPASINNVSNLFVPTVRHTLHPSLETNSQTFNSATLDEGLVRPTLLGSSNQFYTALIIGGTIYGPLDYVTSTGATAILSDDITEYVSEEAT